MEYPEFLTEQGVAWLLSTLTLPQLAQLLSRMTDVLYEVTEDINNAVLSGDDGLQHVFVTEAVEHIVGSPDGQLPVVEGGKGKLILGKYVALRGLAKQSVA